MNRAALMVAALSAVFAMPVGAQQSTPAPATASAGPVQAALAPLLAPRLPELTAAGIQEINARTGRNRRDIQVMTRWGPAYFAWPKDVKPVVFDVYLGDGNTLAVDAVGYADADKPLYAAAFDAIVPLALRQAKSLRAEATRPKP